MNADAPRSAGRLIVLEGIDGSGKTTQAQRLVAALTARGRPALHLREPGGTPLGERVRALVLDRDGGSVSPLAEMYLYLACRAQLVEEVLKPALAEGRAVVLERWSYSTIAYQGYGGGLGPARVAEACRLAEGGVVPDVAILLDVSPERCRRRIGPEPDRMEARGLEFQRAVSKGYREIFAAGEPRLRVVSADGSPDDVHRAVLLQVRDVL